MAGRPRGFDEGDVLDRAMALFWQNGYSGTGLAQLEEATGLGRQSLYGAFGDKRALFERVVERYVENVLRPGLLAVLEAPGSARANLERIIASWEVVVTAPDFNGCMIGNCIAELSARDPEVADILSPKLELMEGWFRRALERAQRAGELPAKLDVKAVARTLLALSQGLGVVARVNKDRQFVRSVAQSAARLLDAD